MFNRLFSLMVFITLSIAGNAQGDFGYAVDFRPVSVPGLPGLHSYAFAQHNGKWLLIGGRKDGVHARQPFNAFGPASNNSSIYVADVWSGQLWSAPVTTLPTGLSEQLQSTNMNFYQVDDTLYIMGGYAYSPTSADHITFPYLTTIDVAGLIQAVMTSNPIGSYFKQITDTSFAVTGGQLGKIGDTLYLVGGHKFTGRYNPMGNPTYTQVYTNQIRKFRIDNSGSQLSIAGYTTVTDPVHLRRRDYNLLPQVFPDGTEGYTISSGVFQPTADLPFLYPVDVKPSGHKPEVSFNQYLSNYHSAKVSLYDSAANRMHNLFFGGISRYYYQNGNLVTDDNVPFVSTVSRLTRNADGSLQEFVLPSVMPGLKGASAEFIVHPQIARMASDIVKMSSFAGDTILLGHIFGGIHSNEPNAFANNNVGSTVADNTIYEVRLVKSPQNDIKVVDRQKEYKVEVFPNPVKNTIHLKMEHAGFRYADYYLVSTKGQIIMSGSFSCSELVNNVYRLTIPADCPPQTMLLTIGFDNIKFVTQTINKL